MIMCYISYQTNEITSIEKFVDNKTQMINLIDADNKLPEDITQKNYVILMACAIKDDASLIYNYSQKKHCQNYKVVVVFYSLNFEHKFRLL